MQRVAFQPLKEAEIVGDEIMCVFPDAEHAYLAAIEMQIRVNELATQPLPDSPMQPSTNARAIRVGRPAPVSPGADSEDRWLRR